MNEPAITVDHVSKKFRLYHDRNQTLKAAVMRGRRARYEEFWALRDVSLEIEPGCTFGFIGTNGSGKSTLLKCLARILRPDEGTATTRGKVSALLELGAGFHQELSGRENVYLNGSILGLSKQELDRRFDDIVEFAGLERFIDTPVKNYSSGMYVRLGFSVAINVDPDILLIDEVLAVGDEEFQRRCGERFAALRKEGKTIVVVSHALGSVQNICDEVAWLDQGVLKEVGPAADVCAHYLGQVHSARLAVHETTGARWGSGEVKLDAIELLGPDGTPRTEVETGGEMTVRCHYRCEQRIEAPVFFVAIHRSDGVQLTSPTTRDGGLEPASIDGSGVVDLVVPSLALLPGTYDVSAGVTDHTAMHVYDQHHRALRFDVVPGHPREAAGGVLTLQGAWSMRPDGTPRAG